MSRPETIDTYLRAYSPELGQRIIEQFPPLHAPHDALSPRIRDLLGRPYPAQSTVLMGIVKAWREGPDNAVILGEMGTGKTLISLGALHVHSEGRPYTALAMVPPHLVNKWAREALKTIPRVRVFLIDGMRDDTSKSPNGIHEVRLRRDDIVRDGLATTVSDLRLRKTHRTARDRWLSRVNQPSIFVVGRETAKLGPYWRHAYNIAKSGGNRDRVVDPDTGLPVLSADGERLTRDDFDDFKRSEKWQSCSNHPCRERHSALWQVAPDRVRRVAPVDFIGRYEHATFCTS